MSSVVGELDEVQYSVSLSGFRKIIDIPWFAAEDYG
jgi:hypothetical protein